MENPIIRYLLIILLALCLPTLGQAQTNYPIPVFVSILPLKYFVKRIGGNNVDVTVMVGPGQEPETYEPEPQKMSRLSDARLYYRIGVPFENTYMQRLEQINPKMKVIDLRQKITLRHTTIGTDPHIWTSPPLVMIMAKTIRNSLITIDPEGKNIYEKGYNDFIVDLKKLHQTIQHKLQPLHQREFMVFHPAWGYFADTYNMKQIAIETEGKEAGPKDLQKFIHLAKEKNIKTIFIQTQFNKTQAKMIARAAGADIKSMDPLAENYLNNMYNVANTLASEIK